MKKIKNIYHITLYKRKQKIISFRTSTGCFVYYSHSWIPLTVLMLSSAASSTSITWIILIINEYHACITVCPFFFLLLVHSPFQMHTETFKKKNHNTVHPVSTFLLYDAYMIKIYLILIKRDCRFALKTTVW